VNDLLGSPFGGEKNSAIGRLCASDGPACPVPMIIASYVVAITYLQSLSVVV
jgi:hypothetical protein